jgi:hypothetical protein
MFDISPIKNRKEKEKLLIEIIEKLSISQTEKDIYTLSLGILEEPAFDEFFIKIMSQFQSTSVHTSITPLSSNLL